MAESDFIEDGGPSITLTHTIHPLKSLDQKVIPLTEDIDVRLTKVKGLNAVTYIDKTYGELAIGVIEGTGTENVVEYYVVRIVGDARQARLKQMRSSDLTETTVQDVLEYELQRLGYTARQDDDSKILLPFHRRVVYHDMVPPVMYQFRKKQKRVLMHIDYSETIVAKDGTALLIPRKSVEEGEGLTWKREVRGESDFSDDTLFPYRKVKGLEFEKTSIDFHWWRLTTEKELAQHALTYESESQKSAYHTMGRHALRNDGAVHVLVRNVTEEAYGTFRGYEPNRYYRGEKNGYWMVVSLTNDWDRWEHSDLWEDDERALGIVEDLKGNRVWMLQFHMRYFRLLKGKPFNHPKVRWGIDEHAYNSGAQADCVTGVGFQVARFGKSYDQLKASLEAPLPEWAAGYRNGKLPEVPPKITKTVITFGNDWENGSPEVSERAGVPKDVDAPPLVASSEGPAGDGGWWLPLKAWKKLFGK